MDLMKILIAIIIFVILLFISISILTGVYPTFKNALGNITCGLFGC